MKTNAFQLHLGDCLQSMRKMPDQSVHCCVTSPPYFGLRDYGVDGQMGLEATPEEFVAALVVVMREVKRVLRDDGTLWLNLGDSYARNPSKGTTGTPNGRNVAKMGYSGGAGVPDGLKEKDLVGIPWRVAFALQADGWYLRQDIIWQKPNPMPESVTDRCTKSHEYVFLLSKSPRYYFDHVAIKEPAKEWHGQAATFDRGVNAVASHVIPGQSAAQHRPRPSAAKGSFSGKTEAMADTGQNAFRAVVPLRNRRSVWTIATRPFKGAHFATFPPALIEPCILAGCPVGGVVLDPFGGSGTTAGVALAHGREAVVCELNAEYADLMPARIASIVESYGKAPKVKRKPKSPAQGELLDGAHC
jgi:site-specific DNA-methyltransferase (adenine-specific)